MRPLSELHAVVPAGIDDAALVSGGNVYDRRVLDGLRATGRVVAEHAVAGSWPRPDGAALARLAAVVATVPPRGLLLLDGLVASCANSVLVPAAAAGLRVVVLVHLPIGLADPLAAEGERRVLTAASAVVTTSDWARDVLLDAYALAPDGVHVARPGVDRAPSSVRTADGTRLLCVAAITGLKGHADLVAALALVADLPWSCVVAGALDRDPAVVAALRGRLSQEGLTDRVHLVGALHGTDLEGAYAAADLLVLPSHVETYGMVVTEALAHGLPVVATAVGGLPEALGEVPGEALDGTDDGRPGLLVPPGRPDELADALRSWLTDGGLRERLRRRALHRRLQLSPWSRTVEDVSAVLSGAGDL
ncbi:glycosyltransferase family 4 protein [Terrabacter sp. 2YAF2]|uniref:glycosyltransferase family 4 protein n=1 Tax=Terrabacter sp. 2YAF2 TaxID=3233026 RepID=UPI003F99C7C3